MDFRIRCYLIVDFIVIIIKRCNKRFNVDNLGMLMCVIICIKYFKGFQFVLSLNWFLVRWAGHLPHYGLAK